jgi:hypothetical protein
MRYNFRQQYEEGIVTRRTGTGKEEGERYNVGLYNICRWQILELHHRINN